MPSTKRPRSTPNVYVQTYDPAILEYVWPEWPALSHQEKYALLDASRPDPRDAAGIRESNVTCAGLHRFLASAMDPEQNVSGHAAQLVVGTGGSSGTSSADTDLNSRVGATDVTDTVYNESTAELQVTTFADSTQFNGYTLDEVGIVGADGALWNHAALGTSIEKSNVKTFVCDVYFSISSA